MDMDLYVCSNHCHILVRTRGQARYASSVAPLTACRLELHGVPRLTTTSTTVSFSTRTKSFKQMIGSKRKRKIKQATHIHSRVGLGLKGVGQPGFRDRFEEPSWVTVL